MIQRNAERILATAAQNPDIQRLLDVSGIGIMTAAALAASKKLMVIIIRLGNTSTSSEVQGGKSKNGLILIDL
jgi:transposase